MRKSDYLEYLGGVFMNILNTRTAHLGVFSGVLRRDPPSACLSGVHGVLRRDPSACLSGVHGVLYIIKEGSSLGLSR